MKLKKKKKKNRIILSKYYFRRNYKTKHLSLFEIIFFYFNILIIYSSVF